MTLEFIRCSVITLFCPGVDLIMAVGIIVGLLYSIKWIRKIILNFNNYDE